MSEEATRSIDIPDSLFAQHFDSMGGGTESDTTTDASDGLDDDAGTLPDLDDDSTPDAGDGLDDPDLDDDEDDTSGDLDDDDPAQDPAENGEDDLDADTGKTPPAPEDEAPFDRKEIDAIKDPEAKRVAERAYRNFQKAFTQKTQELAEVKKTAEAEMGEAREWKSGYLNFLEDLGTEQGGEHFLLTVAGKVPHIFTETVLVDLALRDPEGFARAYEQSLELAEDQRARRVFEGERDLRVQKHREGQEKQTQAQQAATKRQQTIQNLVTEESGKLGVSGDAVELVRDSVENMLRRKAAAGERATAADVRAHIARVAKQMGKQKTDAAKAAQAAERKKRADEVRRAAKSAQGNRPIPPGTSAPGKGSEYKPPARNVDRMAATVDHYFG